MKIITYGPWWTISDLALRNALADVEGGRSASAVYDLLRASTTSEICID